MINETNKQYHSNSAVSKSTLSKMGINPAYYKWYIDNPQEPTNDLIFGSAYHKWILEEEDFDKEFIVMPNIDKRTKEGKAIFAEFEQKVKDNDLTIITQEQFDIIKIMKEQLMANKYARKLLSNGNTEKSFYWTDEMTQIECKCRPDYFSKIKDKVVIVDLKSCRSANQRNIERDVVDYGYDLQTYMYCKGLSVNLDVPLENFMFIFMFQEKKEPYQVNIVQANEYVLQRGENLFREYLGTLKYCRENNHWYGYEGMSGLPTEISVPSWLIKELENKENE